MTKYKIFTVIYFMKQKLDELQKKTEKLTKISEGDKITPDLRENFYRD